MSIKEVFIGDYSIDLPKPFKRDKEWLDYFMRLNLFKYKVVDQDKYNYDNGAYFMIKNIGYLFTFMGDFICNKDKRPLDLWGEKMYSIKKRIEVINNCLDVYDIIYPYTNLKPVLSMDDVKTVHDLMDKILYSTSYLWMEVKSVDLDIEVNSPGWIDLKKVLLRFFSKIKLDREFERFEEEVEGTGLIRPLYRKDGSIIKVTSLNKEDEDENGDLNQ